MDIDTSTVYAFMGGQYQSAMVNHGDVLVVISFSSLNLCMLQIRECF